LRPKPADFWSGLALAALGGYIVFEAARWGYLAEDGPGPGFLPLWYGIAMVALSAALVVKSALGESHAASWRGAGRALGVWAAFVACLALLKLVGFVIGFAAFTFFIGAVMYRRRPLTAALAALGVAAGFYAVFPLALGVALP
jgi:putative tricarboxylic transport membrane protein